MKVNMILIEDYRLMYLQMLDHLMMVHEIFLKNDWTMFLDEKFEK
jgi:hypothetical protein